MPDFDDLLAANAGYARDFALKGAAPYAVRGVAILTCMDARLEPLAMFGLSTGDAKVLRNPGGHLDEGALNGLILAVQLLRVNRICVVEHTRCAMAGGDDQAVFAKIAAATGDDASWCTFGADPDQPARVSADVAKLRAHPLVGPRATIGGFLYDVDDGRLSQLA
ncbi:beta-class carbonic anhydrase [Propionibacterium cyclohexanicum]|uniref:beta-class carbonic anhydrase n=1 Tax=Propionibacterium cyclohexanicum TaxID=64702 RepID=UPI001FE1DBB2|nr:carbonic anhydrase [Propionibacterium cyclohexanicum]